MSLAVRALCLLTLLLVLQPAVAEEHAASRVLTLHTKGQSSPSISELNPKVFKRFDEFASWSPKEWMLLKDVSDSHLDKFSLFEASLVVAGHDAKEISTYRKQLDASISRCRSTLPKSNRKGRLKAIFRHLSKDFLYGEYRADLFDVGKTLREGEFNCLTATVLFQTFSRAYGIDSRVLWEPSHVQCWSPLTAKAGYIIETTAALPDNAISPLTYTSDLDSRELSNTEFVGKIFYNRGVRALMTDRYPEALLSTWACCVLDDADRPAQSNLRACINNWALMSAQKRDIDLVQRLFDVGMKLDPNYEPFSRNRALLLNGPAVNRNANSF